MSGQWAPLDRAVGALIVLAVLQDVLFTVSSRAAGTGCCGGR